MKQKLIPTAIIAVMMGGFAFHSTKSEEPAKSELSIANIEALTSIEQDGYDKGCADEGDGCTTGWNVWKPTSKAYN